MKNKLKSISEKIGVAAPEVLLPQKDKDISKWAVVACDQYTSQLEYWDNVDSIVGNSPSALRLILPEVYLESNNVEERIQTIDLTMEKYLDEGILVSQGPCFIYLDRQTPHVESRKGIILAVDLEKYDYVEGSQTLIRTTENTVIDRLPPRVKIRKNAPIELPHIQLLIDDPNMTVIEPLAEITNDNNKMEPIYDFDLMMGGGHIKGYKIVHDEIVLQLLEALEKLADPTVFKNKYDVANDNSKGVLLFAVGDGNHSLASAKVHWENVKTTLLPEDRKNHPARYAMVEVINVHDKGLVFEPIHRVLFNVNPNHLINSLKEYIGKYSPVSSKIFDSKETLDKELLSLKSKDTASSHTISYVFDNEYGLIIVENPKHNLDVATLQEFLDKYIEENKNIGIDYIHGEEVVTSLGSKEGNMGFYLPSMDKNQLFKTVIMDGTLPRKTFSMGEAEEKRYYLECRKIK